MAKGDTSTSISGKAITPVDAMLSGLEVRATVDVVSRSDATKSIMGNILDAETLDDMFAQAEAGAQGLSDYVGKRVTILDRQWMKGSTAYEESLGYFAVVKIDDAGKEKTVTCGGSSFMAQLWKISEVFDALPLSVEVASKRTTSGFDVLYLKP